MGLGSAIGRIARLTSNAAKPGGVGGASGGRVRERVGSDPSREDDSRSEYASLSDVDEY